MTSIYYLYLHTIYKYWLKNINLSNLITINNFNNNSKLKIIMTIFFYYVYTIYYDLVSS